jgi:lysophospholipase L1-like esterase
MALAMMFRSLILAGAVVLGALAWRHGVVGPSPDAPGPRIVMPEGKAARSPARHILILGASLTSGQAWPGELQSALRDCAPDAVVQPLARAGMGSDWGRAALARYLDLARPDIVIVQFAGNDASLAHGVTLAASAANLRAITAMAQVAGAQIFLATMSPAFGREVAERPGLARYLALYRRVAAETGAGLIDTEGDWQALPEAARQLLMPDGLHPTPDGHDRFTLPAYVEALRPVICSGQ